MKLLPKKTYRYIADVCDEIYELDEEYIEELHIAIQYEDELDDGQTDVIKSLVENAKLIHTYFPDEGYGKIADELDRIIIGIDVG